MPHTIAVESGLAPVKKALQDRGYRTVDLNDVTLRNADAIVVSGQDENFLNVQDPGTLAPVISAEGMTPAQVVEQIKARLDLKEPR